MKKDHREDTTITLRGDDIYEEIVRIRRRGEEAALATIIRRVGSTPRKDHAKMLIRQDGSTLGSIGGGCVEAEVWQRSKQVMTTRRPALVKYKMTDDDAQAEGLICGGTVEVFVEPVLSDPQVFILGAGHLGQAIAEMAHGVGFRITVVDDRESFADRRRLPSADSLLVQPFSKGLGDLPVTPGSFVVIVTRGHKHDQVALEGAIQTPACYVGLVGSRRKIQILVRNLLEKGYTARDFRNLYAPIGLNIGSETPQEIAVSVVAEMISVRKGVHKRSRKQRFILEQLEGTPA